MASFTAPDTLLLGGEVFLGKGQPHRIGVAVKGGKIVALGPDDDLIGLADAHTDVVRVGNGLLAPGFTDAHVHPVYAGVNLMRCDLHRVTHPALVAASISDFADRHPGAEWILGAGWAMESFPGGLPSAEELDRIVPDRPAFLLNRDGHGAWVNTVALIRAGIDANTPDPVGGRIERKQNGDPQGTLHESAVDLVARHLPELTDAEHDMALDLGQQHLLSFGITGWQDAAVGVFNGTPDPFEAYRRAEADGRLKARVRAALWWDAARGLEQVEEFLERRALVSAGRRFTAGTVKIMQDGVAENFTAAMTVPYLDGDGCLTGNAGMSFLDPGDLNEIVRVLDAEQFQIHVHALGDRAVREALDAIAAARDANGAADNRHHLAHLQVVQPRDVPRFAALGVGATIQPLWACHEAQMDTLTIPFLGPGLAERQYPFGDLMRSGAHLAAGSDWSVSSPDVMEAIHVAVNRRQPGDTGPRLLPDQALPLSRALEAYTSGSAWINHTDQEAGVIEVGRPADLVLLAANPFTVNADDLHAIKVEQTWIDGEVVYARGGRG